jgi:NADPH:quinone reductase-like Zn-dependent oxidoreductase
MKAIRIHKNTDACTLVYEEVPQPQPTSGEVLVKVYASSVTPAELGWDETWKTKAGVERQFPIPGHELSGVIAQLGANVTDLTVGQAVYGFNDFDQDGSEAEYTLALPAELAPKPESLTHVQAAAVPMAALTAWQAFVDHAQLVPGQTVLIHGAAGGVGTFAVQLAHWAKARVIGVAAPSNRDLLLELGCDQVIDYTTTRFEDVVHDVDVVLDAAGAGDSLDRSWTVLKPGGLLISLAKPPSQEQAAAHGVRALFFIVSPHRDELSRLAALIDAGQLRPVISQVLPLAQASDAYERKKAGRVPGKIVLEVVRQP